MDESEDYTLWEDRDERNADNNESGNSVKQ